MNGPTWRSRLFLHRWAAWSNPAWEELHLPIYSTHPQLGTEPKQVYTQERSCKDCGLYRWRRV